MTQPSLHTTQLQGWLDRVQAGDRAAHNELLRAVGDRLERLARKMLRQFPRVKRWEETGDVLHNALLRLLRALEKVRPTSVRDFFGLAAAQMRRELLDLARHYYGPHGLGAHHDSVGPATRNLPAAVDNAAELEDWCAFHQEVERLSAEEREVVGLIFYHDLKQAQVAELLGISERQVRRHWRSALAKLRHALRDEATEGGVSGELPG